MSVNKLSECVLFYVTCQQGISRSHWSRVLLISTNDLSRRMHKKQTAVVICSLCYSSYADIVRLRIKQVGIKKIINGIVLRDSIRLLFRHSNNCKFIQVGKQDKRRNIIWLFGVGFEDFKSAANSMSINLWIRSPGIMMEMNGSNGTSLRARIFDLTGWRRKHSRLSQPQNCFPNRLTMFELVKRFSPIEVLYFTRPCLATHQKKWNSFVQCCSLLWLYRDPR